eukprot:g24842.t1
MVPELEEQKDDTGCLHRQLLYLRMAPASERMELLVHDSQQDSQDVGDESGTDNETGCVLPPQWRWLMRFIIDLAASYVFWWALLSEFPDYAFYSFLIALVLAAAPEKGRALHPMVIDYSKVDGQMLYSKNSPAVMSQLLSMIFVNFLAYKDEGWRLGMLQTSASIFIVIGLWYAFGDFLEMLSMGAMTGGVYQLLLQSKLLITAVMMKQLKGTSQSELQWNVLIAATLAISAFVMVDSGSGDDDSGIPLMGVAMVLFKVGVSCYAAVLSDAKLKGFASMSMSAKLSLMSLARVIASIGIAVVMEPEAQPSYKWEAPGFFNHWTFATWIEPAGPTPVVKAVGNSPV